MSTSGERGKDGGSPFLFTTFESPPCTLSLSCSLPLWVYFACTWPHGRSVAKFSLENCHLRESTERPLITKGVRGVEGAQVSKRATWERGRDKETSRSSGRQEGKQREQRRAGKIEKVRQELEFKGVNDGVGRRGRTEGCIGGDLVPPWTSIIGPSLH